MKKLLPLFFFTLIAALSIGQNSIRFTKNNLEAALSKAKQKDKLIFVDTYAPWCIPCKKMDEVFRDPELSTYFNNTFVNLRINMDDEIGKYIHSQYEVVFLPTLLILDKNGFIRFKIDQLISAKNLLAIAKQIAEPELYAFHNNKMAKETPVAKPPTRIAEDSGKKASSPKKNDDTKIKEDEKILYVLDSKADVPPEVLYQEAYFRMQFMDNSHREAAKEYLATQKQWTTPRNLRFIYDFLYATNTEEFKYFIAARPLFEKEIGKQEVAQTIQILVNDRLQRGFPRPDLDETLELVSLMGDSDAAAYEYYLDRLYNENKISEFIEHAEQYLRDINSNDHRIMFRLAECQLLTTSNPTKEDYKACLDLVHKATLLHEQSYEYWETQAFLYFRLGNKKKASYSIKKAIHLANEAMQEIDELLILQKMIGEL